LTYSFNLTN